MDSIVALMPYKYFWLTHSTVTTVAKQ